MRNPVGSGTALHLAGVSKRLGHDLAVAGVSLDVKAGEFLTLLGPSGSGKTTTLNLIAGFLRPDAGEIVMDGRDIANLPPHQRNIGMVFQHYALFPHLSAFDNVAFALRERKVARREISERVERVLELVRLSNLAGRFPAQLSGGQQQRVALARAMVFNPGLLLMDEPLGALDRKLREWLQLEIKRIHREVGITFVYVTHDQEEALVLSDRIAVFNHGRIEQVGSPEELYERPRTIFVAEFVGESNLFIGPVAVDGNADSWVLCGEQRLPIPSGVTVDTGVEQAIMIRPERLTVELGGDSDRRAATMFGRVRQIVYLGPTRRIEVELAGGRTLIVREGTARSRLSEGDNVRVTWTVEDSVVLGVAGSGRSTVPGPVAHAPAAAPPT
jgi:spermidine/putrescine ABC transporter ATP-binding subunit